MPNMPSIQVRKINPPSSKNLPPPSRNNSATRINHAICNFFVAIVIYEMISIAAITLFARGCPQVKNDATRKNTYTKHSDKVMCRCILFFRSEKSTYMLAKYLIMNSFVSLHKGRGVHSWLTFDLHLLYTYRSILCTNK